MHHYNYLIKSVSMKTFSHNTDNSCSGVRTVCITYNHISKDCIRKNIIYYNVINLWLESGHAHMYIKLLLRCVGMLECPDSVHKNRQSLPYRKSVNIAEYK